MGLLFVERGIDPHQYPTDKKSIADTPGKGKAVTILE